MMEVSIYFYAELPTELRAFEDGMADLVEPWARITASGTGTEGSSLDLAILDEGLTKDRVLIQVKRSLHQLRAPINTTISIDGEEEQAL